MGIAEASLNLRPEMKRRKPAESLMSAAVITFICI